MSKVSKAVHALGVLLLLGTLVAGAAQATSSLSFQMKNGNAVLAATEVTIYLSYGKEIATTDATGKATFTIESGKGFWVEVQGQRLARFFLVEQAPAVIDVAEVGVMQWRGGR